MVTLYSVLQADQHHDCCPSQLHIPMGTQHVTGHDPHATLFAPPSYSPHQPYDLPGDPCTPPGWDRPVYEWTQRHALQDKVPAQATQGFQPAPGLRNTLDWPFPYADGQPSDLQACSIEMMVPVMPLPMDPCATRQGCNGLLSSPPCTKSNVLGQPQRRRPRAILAHGALSDVSNPSTPRGN